MEVRKGPFAVFFLSPTPFSQPANSQTPDEAIAVPVVNGFIIFSILHVNIMYKYTLYIYIISNSIDLIMYIYIYDYIFCLKMEYSHSPQKKSHVMEKMMID